MPSLGTQKTSPREQTNALPSLFWAIIPDPALMTLRKSHSGAELGGKFLVKGTVSDKGCGCYKVSHSLDRSSQGDLREPPDFMASCFDFSSFFYLCVFQNEKGLLISPVKIPGVYVCVCVCAGRWGGKGPLGGRGGLVWRRAVRNCVSPDISPLGDPGGGLT